MTGAPATRTGRLRSQDRPRARRRARSRRALRAPGPRVRRALLIALPLLALLAGGYVWLRGSSLVAVRHVTITGLSGPGAAAVREDLRAAAERQTTLAADPGALRRAVADRPLVAGLRVSTDFPHGMAIDVVSRRPVAVARIAGRSVPVAPDGTLLEDLPASGLPRIELSATATDGRLDGARARAAVALLAAAPAALRAKVGALRWTARGFGASLEQGPTIYFGGASIPRAKWAAATAVLADPSSEGAGYIDVRLPGRPLAGPASP